VCRIEQWPHTHAVARKHDPIFAAVPNSKGEVAVEDLDAVSAHRLIRMEDHLGIGIGTKSMASCNQIPAQLNIIEYFSVERNSHGAVGTDHRLLATQQIDHR